MTTSSAATIQALETKIAELEARGLPPEDQVRAFKARVYRVAMLYKKENRWCDEYDRLLKAAGVAPNLRTLTVETMVPAALSVQVNADDFDRLTPEEQTAFLTSNLAYGGGTIESKELKVEPVRVAARNVQVVSVTAEAPTVEARIGTPPGYVVRWTSVDGRVGHYVEERRGGGVGGYSLCGTAPSYQWVRHAPARATFTDLNTPAICARCTQRARNP